MLRSVCYCLLTDVSGPLPETSVNYCQHTVPDTGKQRGPEVYSGENMECRTAEKKTVSQEEQIKYSGCVLRN